MADHTLINLDDVKDSAPAFGLGEVHEARFATGPLEADQLGVAFYRMRPEAAQPFSHRHASQEEIYVLLAGAATAHVGDHAVAMRPRDALRVSPAAVRWFEAGPEGAELLAVGARLASGGGNDAQMFMPR
ncbi:MAG TPA: cupin domain-containing protein [Gaiellales bacterium]|nr:cupin domain-containing protein [Gaiellales bacterium]